MIVVKVDAIRLEYDIHSLLKAYFPTEQIVILSPETDEEKVSEYEKEVSVFICLKEEKPYVKFYMSEEEKTFYAKEAFLFDEENTLKKSEKNKFKTLIYQALCDYCGKKLPWGNLIGIRPTKIAMSMLYEGKSEKEIDDFMKNEHFVSDEKRALALDIAKREKKLLDQVHIEDGYSLYVGIPFCPTRCLYCSFTSNPIKAFENSVQDYLDCICKELDCVAEIQEGKILDTVYIGGGTPTTLEPEQLDFLISAIEKRFDLSNLLEFTVEAGRPDSITREKLEVLKAHNVTRISVNPQTMCDDTLRLIGRNHTPKQTKEAFLLARELGFDNINMDIILALPKEDEKNVAYTMQEIEALKPDSLTVHSLAIKRASKLREVIEKEGIKDIENTDDMMKIAATSAENLGLFPYYLYRQKNMSGNFENVGYAKEEKAGIYNILIMEEVQTIIACGAGTVTKRVYTNADSKESAGRIERCDNVKDVKLYIEKIDEMIERKWKLFEE